MKKICIIDKAPSRNNYTQYFAFDYEHFHMSQVPMTKLLKKDVTLEIDLEYYDLVILVGSEAAKEYAKITSVTNHAGVLKDGKFVCMSNPAMLIFKPEGKVDFERTVAKINGYVEGRITDSSKTGDFGGINSSAEAMEFLLEVLNSNAEAVALDTETTCLYPRDGYVLGLSISYKPKHGRYILTDCMGEEHIEVLQQILDKYVIVFHNLKFDYKMIAYHLGLKFSRTRLHDTMTMHYVLDENEGHGLKALALKYPNSVQQLRKVLFDYCKLTPTGKLTATGALSTDVEVLTELSEQHPLPGSILKVRQLGKIQNTYVNKILPELDNDGRIRTNFNLIFTTSGRLSSSGKFNAQQIPRDNPIIKGCIQAPVGYKIVSQDLATAEMYGAAILSGDTELMKVFSSGGDFHSTIAKMVFNLPCAVELVKSLYPAMRQSAKAISFGILYGSGPKKVAETVTKATGEYYSLIQAKNDIESYFDRFKKLKKWLKDREQFIKANGYTYSFFGRKRRLMNVFSQDKGIAAHEVRSGINAEIQSWASDVNLLGAMDTADSIGHLDAKIFMLVHDSVVALVKDEHIEEYCKILKECMQKDRGCTIAGTPIGVDQEIGQDYSFGKFDKVYRLEDGILIKIEKEEIAVEVNLDEND